MWAKLRLALRFGGPFEIFVLPNGSTRIPGSICTSRPSRRKIRSGGLWWIEATVLRQLETTLRGAARWCVWHKWSRNQNGGVDTPGRPGALLIADSILILLVRLCRISSVERTTRSRGGIDHEAKLITPRSRRVLKLRIDNDKAVSVLGSAEYGVLRDRDPLRIAPRIEPPREINRERERERWRVRAGRDGEAPCACDAGMLIWFMSGLNRTWQSGVKRTDLPWSPSLSASHSFSVSRCTLGQKIESTVQRSPPISLASSRHRERDGDRLYRYLSILEYRRVRKVNVAWRENSGKFEAANARIGNESGGCFDDAVGFARYSSQLTAN